MVDRNKLNYFFWNSPNSEALYQVKGALTMKYRGGWQRLVHPSDDYARDSGTTTMSLHAGQMQDIPCHRAVHLPMRSRGLDSVQTTSEKSCTPS